MEAFPVSVTYRPPFPDEEGRARYLDLVESWAFTNSHWFLAVGAGPERILATVRYAYEPASGGQPEMIHFRFGSGPDLGTASQREEFIAAFVGFLRPNFFGQLRMVTPLPDGHFLEDSLRKFGFGIRHSEYHLEIPLDAGVHRSARICRLLKTRGGPMAHAVTRSATECSPEQVIPLLAETSLMKESSVRAIWNSPDPTRFDRNASACVFLGEDLLGVALCADAGNSLRVMALAGRGDIPGAERFVMPMLMQHMATATAHRSYEKVFFRANAATAVQTRNFALRTGGVVSGKLHRWSRDFSEEQRQVAERVEMG